MMSHATGRRYFLTAIILGLLVLNAAITYALFHHVRPELRVSVLDIGQGDSILVTGPTGVTMLIDGGPDRSVLRELGRELPFWKRSIDMVVETHPDKDHIAGLVDVFARYRVSYFLSPGIPGTTSYSSALDDAVVHEPGVRPLIARRGMRIHLGSTAYADVLYPDHDVSKGETNDGSVTMHVVFGQTSFMLTGDLPSKEEDYLVALDAGDGNLPSTVLKAGHHGSRFSTDDAWLAAVHPQFVAISAGKDNTYGHPSPDALARVRHEGAQILSTIDRGTIHFISDGMTVTYR